MIKFDENEIDMKCELHDSPFLLLWRQFERPAKRGINLRTAFAEVLYLILFCSSVFLLKLSTNTFHRSTTVQFVSIKLPAI